LDTLDELATWGLVPPVVVADAGYGQNADFRAGLADRDIAYVVAIRSDVTAHPHHADTRCPALVRPWPPAAAPLPGQAVPGGRPGHQPWTAGIQ